MNKNEIIIFDRFIYDCLLALSYEFNFSTYKRIKLFKICCRLLPNPDLIIILDIPPKVSFLRKKEEIKSLKNAKTIWEKYQELYHLLDILASGQIIRINNTQRLDVAKTRILKIILDFVEGEQNGR
jgi:thymidylate kinase